MRLGHLRRTINALQKNRLATKSCLYIFSDAPRPGDEQAVEKLRSYLCRIEGFKSVEIVKRPTNDRIFNSRDGIRQMLATHGRFIFLEEDIVTAPGFLTFMNSALNFYADHDKVLSITGYSPPIRISPNYRDDYFSLKRFSGWGFASWRQKFDLNTLRPSKRALESVIKDKNLMNQFGQNGLDMAPMLKKVAERKINALDVELMYHQFANDLYTIYPRRSLSQNIGHDGSGEHCTETKRFQHHYLWDKTEGFIFRNNISPDPDIVKANYDFRNYSSFRNRLSRFLNK